MKAKLQKNVRDIHVYWPAIFIFFCVAALIVFIIFSHEKDWSMLAILPSFLFLLKIIYDPYYITDNNQLTGNSIIIIPLIQQIIRIEKGGLKIYYTQMEGGKVRSRSYYPKDEQFFIDNLLAINPDIKL